MTPESFHPEYLQRLPLPLAQLYRRAYNAKDPRGRHDAAFYLFEAGVKLGAAAHVQTYHREFEAGGPRAANVDELLRHLSLPSLGHWVGIIRELARHFGRRADHATHPLGHVWEQLSSRRRNMPGVLALFRRIKNGPDGEPSGDQSCTLLELFEAMVQYRNGVFGHGGLRFDSFFAEEMGPLMFPAINEVLADGVLNLSGPRGSRLIYLGDTRPTADGQMEITVRELSGTDGWTAAPLVVDEEVPATGSRCGVAIVWPGHRRPLLLEPLLAYREGELADEVLFLNRDRNGREVEYLSYSSGRTLRDAATAPVLAQLMARLVPQAVAIGAGPASGAAAYRGETGSREVGNRNRRLEDFEVVSELGRGAVGVVYLARQRSLGRLVALKMLARELAADEMALMRFRREMRALSRCDHPNVVKVLSSGTMPDGQMYYAMEYVPGCDLEHIWQELYGGQRDVATATLGGTTFTGAVIEASRKEQQRILKRHQHAQAPRDRTKSKAVDETRAGEEPMDPAVENGEDEEIQRITAEMESGGLSLPSLPSLSALEDDPGGYQRRVAMIIREAAVALSAVHEQDIVHRDIKPANLMLTADGSRVVLMDFGLAKGGGITMSATRSAGFLGTLRYAAPEQLAAGRIPVGPAADIRALGVVFWELLTRHRLFSDAEDEAQLSQMIFSRDVPRLRAIDSTLDRDLEAIVARATERDAGDRISSAARLVEYIDLYLEGKPLPIRAASPGEMVLRWGRENRRQFVAATAAVAILVATIVGSFIAITGAWRTALKAEASERTQREAAEQSLYVAHMNLAQRAWDRRDTAAVLDILRQHLPRPRTPESAQHDVRDLRDFGWHYLWRVGHEEPRLRGHGGPVKAIAFAPSGTMLASASFDHTVRLWDAAAQRHLATLSGHEAPLFAIAFSRDGKWLASAGGDRIVRVWNVAERKPAFELPQKDVITCLAFSPDGKQLASGGDDNLVWLWDLETRGMQRQLAGHREHVHGLAYSPDGALLASGSGDGTVRLWDAKSEELIAELDGQVADIFPVAFSPQGDLLAAGTTEKTAIVWRLSDRKLIASLGTHLDRVEAIGFSPDGKTLASADGGGLLIFWHQDPDEEKWTKAGQVRAHLGPIYSLAYEADGKRLATGSGDASIRLLSPDPAAADASRDVARADLLSHFDSPVSSVAFAPKSAIVAAGSDDGNVAVCDARTGTLLQRLSGDPQAGAVFKVACSPNGKFLAVGRGHWDEAGLVEIWRQDAKAGVWSKTPGSILSDKTVTSVAFSPDSRTLAVAGFDRLVRIFALDGDVPQLRQTLSGHEHWINDLAFSPDGKTLATASQDYTVRVWDVPSGKCRRVVRHSGMVRSVAISPGEGRWLATGDWDWTVHLLDLTTNDDGRVLKGHRGAVHTVCFAPGGETLASGSYDGTVKLWHVSLGQELITLGETSLSHDDAKVIGTDHRRISALAFSDNGRILAAGSGENHVKLWWHAGSEVK